MHEKMQKKVLNFECKKEKNWKKRKRLNNFQCIIFSSWALRNFFGSGEWCNAQKEFENKNVTEKTSSLLVTFTNRRGGKEVKKAKELFVLHIRT